MSGVDASSEDHPTKRWARVLSARAEYLVLSEELDGHILTQNEFGGDGLQQSDSLQLLSSLGRQRAAAFEKYKRALGLYWKTVHGQSSGSHNSTVASDLTPREREVLAIIAQGKTSKEISVELGIAFKTVVCHRSRIMMKLDVHNTADLTRAAIRMGLIDL